MVARGQRKHSLCACCGRGRGESSHHHRCAFGEPLAELVGETRGSALAQNLGVGDTCFGRSGRLHRESVVPIVACKIHAHVGLEKARSLRDPKLLRRPHVRHGEVDDLHVTHTGQELLQNLFEGDGRRKGRGKWKPCRKRLAVEGNTQGAGRFARDATRFAAGQRRAFVNEVVAGAARGPVEDGKRCVRQRCKLPLEARPRPGAIARDSLRAAGANRFRRDRETGPDFSPRPCARRREWRPCR